MNTSRALNTAAWTFYVLAVAVHMTALAVGAEMVQSISQPLLMPALLVVLLSAVPLAGRTVGLLIGVLTFAWLGDLLPQFTTWPEAATVTFFLVALVLYVVLLAPLWARNRDAFTMMLAVPYAGVVIGLFIACADGAGPLLPLVLLYAIMLALVAFFSAGVNTWTWVGGTLLLASSSVLGISWFLPGAWFPRAELWVMSCYLLAQPLLLIGALRTIPVRRWDPQVRGGSLVVIET